MKNEADKNGPNSPQPAGIAPDEKILGLFHRLPRSEAAFVEGTSRLLFPHGIGLRYFA